MTSEHSLVEHLVSRGMVSMVALEASRRERDITGRKLSVILVRNGFVRQAEMIEAILAVAPEDVDGEIAFISTLPSSLLEATQTMALAETPDQLVLATLDDETRVAAEVAEHDSRQIVFRPASIERIDDYLSELTRIARSNDDSLLDRLVRDGLRKGFSDIHILPRSESYTVSGRFNGEMQIVREGELTEYNVLAARIKDRSGMDLSERRVPQSGGFSVEHNQRLVDMRVEATPALHGEKIVIRLLDPDAVNPKLDSLGISRLAEWRKGFTRRNGLCLICGPTGSGKTTTLNATIREMDRFGRHICTIEDPVEYAIPFVTQVNVNYSVGLDFSKALRSFLRLDPDVIIQGEVRDEETAALAIKAAETGHLVIATLHTSSISSSIERLQYLGVEPHALKYLLRSILVQNLVRVLCGSCSGKGCARCQNTGFSKRTIVSECAYFPDENAVSSLIDGAHDWPLLIEDAVDKMRQGVTTEAEIERVFAEEARPYLVRAKGAA